MNKGILRRMTDLYLSYRAVKIVRDYNESVDALFRSDGIKKESHDYMQKGKYKPAKGSKTPINSYDVAKYLGGTKVWFRKVGRIRAERILRLCRKNGLIVDGKNGDAPLLITDDGYKLLEWPARFHEYYNTWPGAFRIISIPILASLLAVSFEIIKHFLHWN